MQKPLTLNQREASAVLDAYDLGKLLFTRPGAGTANPALVVVTKKGEFFLKRRNPRYSDPGWMSYDHTVIRHLAKSGLPVTKPIRTRSGSRWLDLDGKCYEVYPLMAGEQHTPGDTAQLESAGKALAGFHNATRDLEPAGEKPLAQARLHDPKNILRGLKWARDQLASGATSEHGGIKAVLRLIEATEHLMRVLPDKTYDALPHCIIHGDYHPGNLKFKGADVIGIFDLDWVSSQPRMVDVADALIYFCGARKRPIDPDDIVSLTQAFQLDRKLAKAFGRGYSSGVTLLTEELQALPNLLRARWLFSRVDAMERKIPDDQKLDYLLEGIEAPLEDIARLERRLVNGEWLAGATPSRPPGPRPGPRTGPPRGKGPSGPGKPPGGARPRPGRGPTGGKKPSGARGPAGGRKPPTR